MLSSLKTGQAFGWFTQTAKNDDPVSMANSALSTKQIILRIIGIISLAEYVIMLLLGSVPSKHTVYQEAVVDIILLAIMTTPLIYVWVVRPFVMARDEALRHISHLAHTDPLTKLPNRRLLTSYFQKYMASAVRHNTCGAVLLLDLDRFKPLNDQYGHEAGDHVLIEVASRIQSAIRSEDVVARLGGDEFVILLYPMDVTKSKMGEIASQVANKLVEQINQPIKFNGSDLTVGASIGVRLFSSDVLDTDTVIREADIAMYHAKQLGKGRVEIFNKS